jgi:pilus assembly protein Flp/PilA
MPVLTWKEVNATSRDRCRTRAGPQHNEVQYPTIKMKRRGEKTVKLLQKFFREEEGANLVEYALLVTFIAIVVITGAGVLGTNINSWFEALASKVSEWTTTVNSAS